MLVERRGSSAKAPKRWHGESASASAHKDAADPDGTTSETEEEDAGDDDDDADADEDYTAPAGGKKRKGPAADAASGKRKQQRGEDDENALEDANQQLEEVLDETSAVAAMATDKDRHGKGTKSEMGVIEEIYCENFMCHRRMRVALSPHINFITGENGSGKSAIIAAIQICLGASARATHRGKSIKNLIRHGHEGNALVRITLRNDDQNDAFQPDVYGKKIIVERLIRRDGSAEYRLKNEHGSLVSKQKVDLEMMLDHLNIQTENPCAILDQENAKLFLKGNPGDKYKFFLQSTDLYKMRTTYSKIDEDTRNISDSVLKREKVKIVTLSKAMKEAEERWEEAQSIGLLEDEFSRLTKELAWSFVREKELLAEKVAKKIELKQREAEIAREKHAKATDEVCRLEAEQKAKNEDLEDITNRAAKTHKKREDVKNKIREARRPLHSYNAELKQLAQQRDRTNQRLHRLKRDIEKKKQAHEAMIQNRMHRNVEMKERIEVKRRELQDVEAELFDATNRAQAPPADLDELESRYDNCLRQLREVEGEISRAQTRISGLKGQKRDSLAVFGNRIPQLQQLIHENRHRFTQPPIGPLGLHVKLPERYMDFAVAIEVALKGTLQSYLVVNGRDKALLDSLKRQVKCPQNQANIIIAERNGQRYGNLRLAEGSLAAHAICNILEVSNDEVFNALVDVCSTESKLIFDNRESAEQEVLRGSSGNFRMARFVSEVYMPNGDKFVVRSGNLAYIANKGNRRSSIICQDLDADIRDLEQKLDYLQGNCEVLRRDEGRLRRDREDARAAINRQHDHVNRLTRRVNQLKMQLRNLEDELTDDVQQNTLDTSVLEDEVAEAHREIDLFKDREKELNDLISNCNPDLEGMYSELEELDHLEKEIAEELASCQQAADVLFKNLSTMKAREMRYERDSSSHGELFAQWQDELAVLREECEELSLKAQRHCGSTERVPVNEAHEYYGKRLTDIRQQIEKEKRRFEGMDLEELQMDMTAKRLKYESKKKTLDRFRHNLLRIKAMLETRKKVWQGLRKEISHRTSMEFNRYMELNNFAGKLKFRHDEQRLDIAVLQNEVGRSRASQVTDMKELSGGERSYTQVSLLLALGESIECPFRVMDEFDVFMDSVNRDMTIQLLVNAAKMDATKQFIFVTPNDLSTLRRDPMVKIQKMDPPRDRLNADSAA